MNWQLHVEKLKNGETVSFRPKGNSMKPKIESGNKVTVSPDISNLNAGDIAFCKVHGNFYVHLVQAVKVVGDNKSYLISNNKGRINGWVGSSSIFGKVIEISP